MQYLPLDGTFSALIERCLDARCALSLRYSCIIDTVVRCRIRKQILDCTGVFTYGPTVSSCLAYLYFCLIQIKWYVYNSSSDKKNTQELLIRLIYCD